MFAPSYPLNLPPISLAPHLVLCLLSAQQRSTGKKVQGETLGTFAPDSFVRAKKRLSVTETLLTFDQLGHVGSSGKGGKREQITMWDSGIEDTYVNTLSDTSSTSSETLKIFSNLYMFVLGSSRHLFPVALFIYV